MVLGLLLGAWAASFAQTTVPLPRVFLVDPQKAHSVREKARAGSEGLAGALDKLRKDARKSVKFGPVTVTGKEKLPPSGDRHDYYSLAPYWWPDPSKPDGKPYIRRDGEVNPERDLLRDRDNFRDLQRHVYLLSVGYYFLGEEDFARHAALLLRTWFIDSTTRMNPHMNYAQAIIGRNEGRGAGLIEAANLSLVVDAIGFLGGSPWWSGDDQRGTEAWFTEYSRWLKESPIGMDEADAPNNHGSWYDQQSASIALFLGRRDQAKAIVAEAKTKRIGAQIEPDGSQPKELARTRSLHYSLFILEALFRLALLGDRLGVDLWHHTTGDGRSIRAALDFVAGAATNRKAWTFKEIGDVPAAEFSTLFHIAAWRYSDREYARQAKAVSRNFERELHNLMYPLIAY